MHDSVPSARYSPVCNVLCLWRIWSIPTYRVYQLYDSTLMLSQYVNDAITLNDVFLEKTPLFFNDGYTSLMPLVPII